MKIHRTITTDHPPAEVFDYMRDFTNTEEWDPGTRSTERISGDGGVGTIYRNISHFMGRDTELEYQVVAEQPGQEIRLRGVNDSVVATDTITVRSRADGGSDLTYLAQFDFNGIAKFLAPLARPAFKRLGDRAEARLHEIFS